MGFQVESIFGLTGAKNKLWNINTESIFGPIEAKSKLWNINYRTE